MGGRAVHCMAQPQSPPGKGFRSNHRERLSLAAHRQREAVVPPYRARLTVPTGFMSQTLSVTLAILEKRSSGQLNTTSSKTPVSSAAR
jgi:hypothetical protein